MDRFEKMLGCQKARNRRGAVVVDEDRPQQRLLGFDVLANLVAQFLVFALSFKS